MDSEHLEAYLSEELDENGRGQVEHALRHDSDLRESFLQQARMAAALRVLLGERDGERGAKEFEKGVMARLRSEGAGDARGFAKSVLTEIVEERERQRPIRWPDLVKTGLISAAASIGLLLLLQSVIYQEGETGSGEGPETGSSAAYAARIERSDVARWGAGSARLVREDGWISPGLLKLEGGSILVGFNSGATAVVEGPAELSIESGNRLFLKFGSLAADVPPAASGFTVNTPQLNVVDIGTRFGVTVDAEGNSELHVMEGEVEASRASGNAVPILVREGLALRADTRTRSELAPVAYGGDRFRLRLGERELAQPAIRYRFDESVGAILEDSGTEQIYDIPMVASGELDRSPRRAAGKRGGGLVFQAGETLDAPLSKHFRLDEPHTVAFWVKLPPKLGRATQEDLLEYGREGRSWKVSCHLNSERGIRGALRISCGEGHVVGGTDIADGNWHHIAYRFIGGGDGDLASRVHLFVDGNLETLSDFRPGSIPSGRAGSLRLGGDTERGFQGWIDELNLFDGAVSTLSIQALTQ